LFDSELILGKEIWKDLKLREIMQKLMLLRGMSSSDIIESIFFEHGDSSCLHVRKKLNQKIVNQEFLLKISKIFTGIKSQA